MFLSWMQTTASEDYESFTSTLYLRQEYAKPLQTCICLTVVVFPLLDFLSLLRRDFLRIDAVSQILYFPLEEMALVRLQLQCWCNTKAEWHHLEFI